MTREQIEIAAQRVCDQINERFDIRLLGGFTKELQANEDELDLLKRTILNALTKEVKDGGHK